MRAVRTKPQKGPAELLAPAVNATESRAVPGAWGACRFCGVAVPAGAAKCEICGAERPLAAAEIPSAPKAVRRRLRLTGLLRSVIVVAVVVGITYAVVSAVIQGPPVLTGDPLNTAATLLIGPGNFSMFWGEITGGDFVIGNFSSVAPAGTNVRLTVYNTTQWEAFVAHEPTGSSWSVPASDAGRIVYSAPVTDNYYFVFSNPYAPSTHLTISVYETTQYESNVAGNGFD